MTCNRLFRRGRSLDIRPHFVVDNIADPDRNTVESARNTEAQRRLEEVLHRLAVARRELLEGVHRPVVVRSEVVGTIAACGLGGSNSCLDYDSDFACHRNTEYDACLARDGHGDRSLQIQVFHFPY